MYQIIIKKNAKKFIDRLPINEKKRVVSAIEQLPNGENIKKMQGYDGLLSFVLAIIGSFIQWIMVN